VVVIKKIERLYTKRHLGKHGVRRRVQDMSIGPLLANHKSINRIHILCRRKKNLWMESFRNPSSLRKSSSMKVLKMKILHKSL
jgi:hypothetical protein